MANQEKVDFYITTNAKYFEPSAIPVIREKLLAADDTKFVAAQSIELKDPTTMLLLSLFLGYLGIDRFMLGDTGMGILKLLTGGCCGVLTIIDWCLITKKTKEYNFNSLSVIL